MDSVMPPLRCQPCWIERRHQVAWRGEVPLLPFWRALRRRCRSPPYYSGRAPKEGRPMNTAIDDRSAPPRRLPYWCVQCGHSVSRCMLVHSDAQLHINCGRITPAKTAKIIGRAMLPIEQHLRLSDLTPDELRGRALEYRQSAARAECADVRDTFQRLADRFERLAQEREGAAISPSSRS
jgi:hypothetical protein